MVENKNVPYIFTSRYTMGLYFIIIILVIFYSYKVYQYDITMSEVKNNKVRYLKSKSDDIGLLHSLSKNEKELLDIYISYVIDKKKSENSKFNKITSSFKNSCITGFISSSLSGAPIHFCIISGITFGTANALYKSITNYYSYKNIDIDNIINKNKLKI